MRRWVTPAIAALSVAAAAAVVWWLMHHDLRGAAYAAAAGVLALVVAVVVLWRRGHRRTPVGLVLVLVTAFLASGGYLWHLNGRLGDIDTIKPPPGWEEGRPEQEPTRALNILLMGSDNPDPTEDKPTVAELMADGNWDPGAYRSDSIMLVHVAADRRSASVVSIPRDSYVPIYDGENVQHGEDKINAAFSYYGPFGTIRTVEHLTGLRINHLAIIDFEGFRDLTTAIGGVDVFVPETVVDPKRHRTWEQGWHHVEGQVALDYVRMRYGLTNGDFDRVARQQNFLRAVLAKLTDDGTIGDPIKVQRVVDVLVDYVTVDADWDPGQLRSFALSLHGLRQREVRYATVPLDHYETIPGVGSANIIAESQARDLWTAVREEKVADYLAAHPDDGLADPQNVS